MLTLPLNLGLMVVAGPTLAPGFFVGEGRRWRMVRTTVGHLDHCQEPADWKWRYISSKGMRWQVWACQEHLEKLTDVRPRGSAR